MCSVGILKKSFNVCLCKKVSHLNDPSDFFDNKNPVKIAQGLTLVRPQLEPDRLYPLLILTVHNQPIRMLDGDPPWPQTNQNISLRPSTNQPTNQSEREIVT
jgi:hypothetical protein